MRDDPIAADMVERVAKAIYDTMREYDAEGARYPWVERGNSDNQDKARRRARAALEGAEGIFVCPACDRQQHEPVSIRGCYHCGHGNPIPRAYAGRDDVAEAHNEVIAGAPAEGANCARVCEDEAAQRRLPLLLDAYAASLDHVRYPDSDVGSVLRRAADRLRALEPFAACPVLGDTGLDPLPPP